MEHFLQNAMKLIIKIRGAILSPRPYLTLEIRSMEMFRYAAQGPGRNGWRTSGRVTAFPPGCPSPQQRPLGCRGAAKVWQQIPFSSSTAKPRGDSGDAQCNHPGRRSCSPLLHRAQQPVTECKRWKNHGPGGTCPTSHPISHETSRYSGPASGLSRVQTEAQPNECSHCEPPWEFVILSLELSGVFPFSHLRTEHRIFHSVHFPSNKQLYFPSPALMKKSVRTHSFLPGTIWCHFSPQIAFGYGQLSPQTRDAHALTPQQLSAGQPGSGHPTAVRGRARSLATLRILAVSKPLLVLWESRTNPGGSANGF